MLLLGMQRHMELPNRFGHTRKGKPMLDYTATGTYVLVVTLVSLFLIVLLWQRQRSGKEITLWLFSGLAGLLLGAGGAAAAVQYLGYELKKAPPLRAASGEDLLDSDGEDEDDEGESEGGGGGGRRYGGGAGGPRTPSPKRQLTTLVRKLEILTGDIALGLSDGQVAAIDKVLGDLEQADTMTDEEAQTNCDQLTAILDEPQKAKHELIGLPRPTGSPPGGRRGSGGSEEEDANPFREEASAQAIKALRQRFQGGADASAE